MKWILDTPEFVKKARETGKGHRLWLEILIFIAVYFICSIGQLVVMFFYAALRAVGMLVESGFFEKLSGGGAPYSEYVRDIIGQLEQKPDYMVAYLASVGVLAVLVILFCLVIEKRKPSTMGFVKKRITAEYGLGFAIGALMFAASAGLAMLTGSVSVSVSFTAGSLGIIGAFLLGFIVQGMGEEVLCRGYFMVSAARKNSLTAAVVSSSVIFALLHGPNNGVSPLALLNIALFGVVMALYMIRRGSIWGVCAIHSAWNFVQGHVFGAPVSGTSVQESFLRITSNQKVLLNGGAFGLEGGLCVTAVLVISIAILLFSKALPSPCNRA